MNNLPDVNVRFPLGTFGCVTGVSGSGKSSLITETLYPALANRLNQAPSSSPARTARSTGWSSSTR